MGWFMTMSKTKKANGEVRGKSRIRAEIVDISRALHKVGAVTDDELTKTTLKMLGKLPKVEEMSPAEIVAVREKARVSQSVMAAFLNVAVSTVSQWERGEKHPQGASLKLLALVAKNGLQAVA